MSRPWAYTLLISLCAGAQELPPGTLLLSRIKRHMAQVLDRQPNYTCLETIERSQRGAKAKRFQLVDALHLEVAVVAGKELFSWPGEREFKDRDLREFAPTGAIANGSFAIHARSVFLAGTPLITYRGEEMMDGRTVARYDYTVPQYRSGYQIRIGDLRGITGYRGSFWNDVETLDVKRLDVEAIEIPPHLPLRGSRETLRYERVAIGASTFLLPKSSEMVLEDVMGGQNRNSIGFSKCRQYSGESTLSFAEVPETDAAPTPLAEAIVLPAGLSIELELLTAIQFPGNAIGDEVEARVRRDVKRKGMVLVPKGALLKGNVAVLARQQDFRGNVGVMVALQWREISFDGKVGPFEGQLEEGGAIPINGSSTRSIYQRPMPRNRELLPHRDVFYVRKDNSQLPRGLTPELADARPRNHRSKKAVIQFTLETDKALFEKAMRFAQKQVKRLIDTNPGFYPMYTQEGKWKHDGPTWTRWCDGFLPGMMWLFRRFEVETGGKDPEYWYKKAVDYTKPLEKRKSDRDVHDLGFVFQHSYYRWFQVDRDPKLEEIVIEAGKTLALRYRDKGNYLRSFVAENSLFIDIMMNVGLVFYAARATGDKNLREIATRHSLTTRRFLVRGDGSTAHEGLFDIETGEFLKEATQQGYRADSCWARGLTWAIYGFSTAYEYSRDPHFLETAEDCADYYITHANADGMAPWDFNAPADQRKQIDTSAAAIAASAFLRLGRLLHDPVKGHFYWNTGIRILRTLSQNHLADKDKEWEGVLKGGVYHLHKELGVNESVMWGDHFFVEALEHALRRI